MKSRSRSSGFYEMQPSVSPCISFPSVLTSWRDAFINRLDSEFNVQLGLEGSFADHCVPFVAPCSANATSLVRVVGSTFPCSCTSDMHSNQILSGYVQRSSKSGRTHALPLFHDDDLTCCTGPDYDASNSKSLI